MAVRTAGLLLHITSLPGPLPIGDFGPSAGTFFEWAESAGQSLWQILPLHPTGGHASPYGAISAFAGNPLLISPEAVVSEGLSTSKDLEDAPRDQDDFVNFRAAREWKERFLRRAWSRFPPDGRLRSDLDAFRESEENQDWLRDWAIFAALKTAHPGSWISWPAGLARRETGAIREAAVELADEVAFQEFLQFLFFRQWERVREEAHRRGIAIIGDAPIYISHDSADVWARRELFSLREDGRPSEVAGVPADAFTPAGQLWGYPLYRWDRMEQDGFAWWVARMRHSVRLFDLVRVDHFRGFTAYWAVPSGDRDATGGRWRPGPGEKLWRTVERALGGLPIIAEDLGTITTDVEQLRDSLGLAGMKVLQFGFSEPDSPHRLRHHTENSVAYTGTHDNDTARGWYAGLSAEERERVRADFHSDGREIEWDMIRAAYESAALRAIVPLQDVFGLGSVARMNHPGKAEGNWTWRARKEDLTPGRAARLKRLAEWTGRDRHRVVISDPA
jgi:4-alpha-glucanotransferase